MPRTPVVGYGAIIQENNDSDSDSDSNDLIVTAVHGTDYNQPSPRSEPAHDRARRRSFIEQDEESLQLDVRPKKVKKAVVTWSSLPHKHQLAILTIARFSEPLVQSSLRVGSSSLSAVIDLI